MRVPRHCGALQPLLVLCLVFLSHHSTVLAWSFQSSPWRPVSSFTGCALNVPFTCQDDDNTLVMRKQKASDKRTRRRQRGLVSEQDVVGVVTTGATTVTTSPMQVQGNWNIKATTPSSTLPTPSSTGGRGRSRKRSLLYTALASYHDKYLHLLQEEYQAEEDEVKGRIKSSLDDPLSLEVAGYALYDMEASRRGKLFADDVYRLSKATDATTVAQGPAVTANNGNNLPDQHKFRPNDVILLTLQPQGSGDFFDPTTTSPLSEEATNLEARVLNIGPTYVDIAAPSGKFAMTLGPASNEIGGGRQIQRFRVDRFFSNIPYQRMVDAVRQLSQIPQHNTETTAKLGDTNDDNPSNPLARIRMDTVLSRVIVATHAQTEANDDGTIMPGNMDELAQHVARPPMAASPKLAQRALRYMMAHPDLFRPLNQPQWTAVQAALTRRLTMIQGPPGTGKTTVAASIGFGMVHQCRSISADSSKVLACAFSNVGADNLAQALQSVGLRVVRIGKPSAVTASLWNNTLDAAIDRDPDARQALDVAAKATARLAKVGQMHKTEERLTRQAATNTVKASQKACRVAATKAMRQADVIVSTSTGAADPRLLAACGIVTGQQEDNSDTSFHPAGRNTKSADDRTLAPDGLAPLSLPFVIIDEACQSVEPATLVPLVSSDTCRSMVLLGDPCQLPPTVRSSKDSASPLAVSLMERLALVLPAPQVRSATEKTPMDTSYLSTLAMKQSRSLLHAIEKTQGQQRPGSYRKRYAGSLLLSIQYRMHPSIAAFSSAIFYDGLLATPSSLRDLRVLPSSVAALFPCSDSTRQDDNPVSFRWVDVTGRNHDRRGSLSGPAAGGTAASGVLEEQTSYLNEAEALQVIEILQDIVRQKDSSIKSIGIISPYAAQVQLIQSMIRDRPSLDDELEATDIELEVKSVDGYQGRERDIMLVSTVRSNRRGHIGFLRDWRRLNVALTRAKVGSIVVGDRATLSASSDPHWAALAQWAQATGCVVETGEQSIDPSDQTSMSEDREN